MDVAGLPPVPGDEADVGSSAPGLSAPPIGPSAVSAQGGWVPGGNVPAVSRAHRSGCSDGLVTPAVQQVLANLHRNLDRVVGRRSALLQIGALRREELELSAIVAQLIGVMRDGHCSLTDSVVARLLGLSPRTVANTMYKLSKEDANSPAVRQRRGRPPKMGPSDRCRVAEDDDGQYEVPEGLREDMQLPGASSETASVEGAPPPTGTVQASTVTTPLSFAIPDALRAEDQSRRAGLRLACLAARCFTSPSFPLSSFTPLVAWLSQHFPGEFGSTNHSVHFVRDLGRTMGAHLQTCQALAHWQLLPALRIPSDFQRVLDGYTCKGEPLLVLLHVLTKPDGSVGKMVVDLSPNAAGALRTERGGAANAVAGQGGRPPASAHRWKSGAAVAEHVALLESGLSMTLGDMLLRHAVTVGDGGYVGPHSVSLMQHWAALLLREVGPSLPRGVAEACDGGHFSWEAACEFHALQLAAVEADEHFPAAQEFDDMLRWLRARFTFGSGRVVARGVAKILGRPWWPTLAPRADGFKATAYSKECGRRFVATFRILVAAVEVELEACYLSAKHAAWMVYEKKCSEIDRRARDESQPLAVLALKRPRPPENGVGLRTSAASAIRAVGRQLLDPRLIICGIGRYELRSVFLTGYSVFTQRFAVSALVKVEEQTRMLRCLQAAVVGLQQMAGALRMLAAALRFSAPRRRSLSAHEVRLMVKVFGGHFLWRWAPSVVQALPDLLVPVHGRAPSFQGVELTAPRFEEPRGPRNAPGNHAPLPRMVSAAASARFEQFDAIADALADLSRWLRRDGRAFERRIMFWDGSRVAGDGPGGEAEMVGPPLRIADAPDEAALPAELGSTFVAEVEAQVLVGTGNLDEAEAIGLQDSNLQNLAVARSVALSGASSDEVGGTPAEAVQDDEEGAPEVAENRLEERALWHVSANACAAVPAWKQPLRPSSRRLFWEAASRSFHPNILVTPDGVDSVTSAVRCVFAALEPLLFRWRPGDLHGWREPPMEVFERIEVEDFVSQYKRLRRVVVPLALREEANSHVVEWEARVQFWQGGEAWLLAWALASAVPGRRLTSCASWSVGDAVALQSPGHAFDGRAGAIVKLRRRVHEEALHGALLRLPFATVRQGRVWHVLRVYHRLFMAGGTTEGLAESVCSTVTHHTHGTSALRPLGDILLAVRLRWAGVTGDVQSTPFLSRCLDIFFRGKPWHFQLRPRVLRELAASCRGERTALSAACRTAEAAEEGAERWEFVSETLRRLAAGGAREKLLEPRGGRSAADGQGRALARNPKAGVYLRAASGRATARADTRALVETALPCELDPRLAEVAMRRA